jgi:hypothetical protein
MDNIQALASTIGSLILAAATIYGVYLQHRQVQLMASLPKSRKQEIKPVYWPLISVAVIGIAVSWLPVVFSKDVNISQQYMQQWGMMPRPNVTPSSDWHTMMGTITADGRLLYNQRNKYELAGIAFDYFGTQDPKDTTDLSKSSLYDIQNGDIHISIPLSETLIADKQQGKAGTNFMLLLVPKGVRMEQFSTIHQAEALGAKVLSQGGGPV